MKKKTYYTTAATVFAIVALAHLIRAMQEWEAIVAGAAIPVWFSWVAVALAGYLAIRGFQLAGK
jgi:hypothetical protein